MKRSELEAECVFGVCAPEMYWVVWVDNDYGLHVDRFESLEEAQECVESSHEKALMLQVTYAHGGDFKAEWHDYT